MPDTETASTPPTAEREPQSAYARRRGVSSKTIDRWTTAGRLPPPERINGRKYRDPRIEPDRDPPRK